MEQITVNLLATGETPVCHVSQFDDGRTIRFNLKKGAEVYTLSGTETVKMRIRKPDDTERVVDIVNTSGSYVDYVSVPEDCDIEGINVCELVIDDLGSKNFLMNVEEDAYGGGADIETLSASGSIATFETNMVDNLVDLKADIEPIQDLHGYDYPWTAGGGKNLLGNFYDWAAWSPTVAAYGDCPTSYSNKGLLLNTKPNTTYTISIELVPNLEQVPKYLYVASANGTDVSTRLSYITNGATLLNATFTFTTTATDIYYLRVNTSYVNSQETFDTEIGNKVKWIQLEVGSTATAFEPYSNICPIYGHDSAQLFRTGKNLLPNKMRQRSAYSVHIGIENANDSIFLKAGTYALNVVTNIDRAGTFLSGDNTAQRNLGNTYPLTFAIDHDDYFKLWVYMSDGITVDDITSFQLEVGSVATAYEPYAGTKVTVQFGQTIYKGVLDAKNSKVIATHGIVDLGTLNLAYFARNTRFVVTLDNGKFTNSGGGLNTAMCECYPIVTMNYGSMPDKSISVGSNFISGSTCALVIHDEAYTTANELKTALSGQHVVYELATPIEIPLSAISQIETLLGINNVYADIGDVELKYLKQM